MFKRLMWLAATVLLLPNLAYSAIPLPTGVERVTSVEGITEYRLANGMKVLLGPDASKATITVNITYLVGSRMESYGETGMAHLLEHLMFKGTRTSGNLMDALGKRGMNFNATTWFDRTNYFESFPATEANLKWALGMEADRMLNSRIAKKDLDSEMTVVRNEMEMGENDPRSVLIDRMLANAFLWHNYGKSTIGARADVENVNILHLQAFYRKYYQPDNAVLALTGRFDEARGLALVAKIFGTLPRPKRKLETTYTLDPVQDGERQVTLRRVGEVQYVGALYHVMPGAHPDYPALLVAASALGDIPYGRLHKRLVEAQLAANIFAEDQALAEPGVVYFGAQLRPGAPVDRAREVLLQTVEGLTGEPITAQEVKRAQARMLKGFNQVINDPEKLGISLSEAIAKGDWRLFFLQRDGLRKVTAADAQRVALAYLKPSNRTLGLFIPVAHPDRAPAPEKVDAAPLVARYRGNAAAAMGEAFDASPENIEKRTQYASLASGLKLGMLPKRTRGATVNGSLRLRLGDEKSLFGRYPAGSFVADMLNRGTRHHTREELQSAFDELNTELQVSGSENYVTITWETLREGLPRTLELIAEMLREPTFPESEFRQLKDERAAAIERTRGEPDATAAKALQRHYNHYPRGDVRYTPTFEETLADINALKLEDVREFHRGFYGASHGELALVGDFDAQEVHKQLDTLLGNWVSPKPYRRVPNPYHPTAGKTLQEATPDKANAVVMAATEFPLQDTDADFPALLLGNHLLGGSVHSRLPQRIREREGLSYSVRSGFDASRFEPNSEINLYAIYAPQNLARIKEAFAEEFAAIAKDGFKASEVKEDIGTMLEERRLARAQDGPLADAIADNIYSGRNMLFEAEIDQRLTALDAAKVNEAWRKHFNWKEVSWAYAGDFTKETKK